MFCCVVIKNQEGFVFVKHILLPFVEYAYARADFSVLPSVRSPKEDEWILDPVTIADVYGPEVLHLLLALLSSTIYLVYFLYSSLLKIC